MVSISTPMGKVEFLVPNSWDTLDNITPKDGASGCIAETYLMRQDCDARHEQIIIRIESVATPISAVRRAARYVSEVKDADVQMQGATVLHVLPPTGATSAAVFATQAARGGIEYDFAVLVANYPQFAVLLTLFGASATRSPDRHKLNKLAFEIIRDSLVVDDSDEVAIGVDSTAETTAIELSLPPNRFDMAPPTAPFPNAGKIR
ncbi:MAG: hypothetical protein JW829_11080 [Pirellulales bacterium]|nr:hypothetical protein [Pirellulales bacterium]